MEMILVQGGSFFIRPSSTQITVSNFYIGRYLVTQKEWKEIMHSNPSNNHCDDCPVEQVSWNEVQEFISILNKKTGRSYRLPTDAEWRFAASGGIKSQGFKYAGSNNLDEVGWYGDNSDNKTHPVGLKKPNELGLYDMSGNVFEWCWDWYGPYPSTAQIDPKGPSTGECRVLHGGSWLSLSGDCRPSYRAGHFNPGDHSAGAGFRLAMSV